MVPINHENYEICKIINEMEKGFLLREALYDDAGHICDFKIVSANKGIDNFSTIPHQTLIGKTLDKSSKHWEALLSILTKVANTGESLEFEYYSEIKNRYIKLYAFSPMPGLVGNFYEFISDSRFSQTKKQATADRIMKVSDYVNEAFWVRKGDKALYVNPAFEKLFGISCSKVYDDIYSILEVVDERDYARVSEMLKNDEAHLETNYHIEFRIKSHDHDYKWLWLKSFYIREVNGEIIKKAATIIDITERKIMEEQLYHYNQEILTLFDLFKKASEQVELCELLNEAQRVISNHLRLNGICIYLYNDQKERLNLVTYNDVPQELLDSEVPIAYELGLPERLFQKRESLVANVSLFADEKVKSSILDKGIKYIGCFPIFYGDKVLGVLLLGLKSDLDLSTGHKEFISAICSQLAVLINNWRLYENLKMELARRKKAEKENELIFNTSIDLLAIMDMDMKLMRIGPHWEKCLGWSEVELLNQSVLTFVQAEDKDNTLSFFDTLAVEGIVIGYENRLKCKNGNFRWFAWNAQVVKENNKKLIVATGRDITRNKEIEAKNRDLEQAFQIETLKMEFFANLSHEFRTPLNIILSALQLIQHSMSDNMEASPINGRAFRHFKSIKQNALRLLRLVNNLIDITKLDSGYLKLYPSNYDIVNVVENITQSVAQYIEGKGINLIFDTNVEEKMLACDADMIERIMLNLLSNAVKYTEKDGFITVAINDLGNVVRISVHDTGVGIAEEKLDYIFERFAQGDRPLSRRCEGSGIGLSLVKSLVELHGGRIYANSTINKGSEFTFELPVVLLDQSANCQTINPSNEERIHKINVEFSDIYSLNN